MIKNVFLGNQISLRDLKISDVCRKTTVNVLRVSVTCDTEDKLRDCSLDVGLLHWSVQCWWAGETRLRPPTCSVRLIASCLSLQQKTSWHRFHQKTGSCCLHTSGRSSSELRNVLNCDEEFLCHLSASDNKLSQDKMLQTLFFISRAFKQCWQWNKRSAAAALLDAAHLITDQCV